MGGNEEMNKLISGIDQVYLSVGMEGTDLTLLLTIRTGSEEHARTLTGLAQMGLQSLGGGTKDKNLKGLMEALQITTQGNEAQLRARIPQTVAAELVNSKPQPAGAKPAASTPAKTTTKRTTQKRATGKRPVKKP